MRERLKRPVSVYWSFAPRDDAKHRVKTWDELVKLLKELSGPAADAGASAGASAGAGAAAPAGKNKDKGAAAAPGGPAAPDGGAPLPALSLAGGTVDHVIDLCGAELTSLKKPLHVTVRRLMLRNGKLRLLEGCRLVLEAPGMRLLEVAVSGVGCPGVPRKIERGIVEVLGAGNTAYFDRCTFVGPLGEQPGLGPQAKKQHAGADQQARGLAGAGAGAGQAGAQEGEVTAAGAAYACLAVGAGAHAHLANCRLTGAGRDGLLSWGALTRVVAELCEARGCGASGFASVKGSRMGQLTRCVAYGNGTYGFCSEDPGSFMEVGAGCRSERNNIGYGVTHNGAMMVADGSIARRNRESGFSAAKVAPFTSTPPSSMTVGRRCVAELNATGFMVLDGCSLVVGEGSVARGSTSGAGFLSSGPRSVLTVGANCRAEGCAGAGFACEAGGKLTAGDACVALGNTGYGFCSDGDSRAGGGRCFVSTVVVGARCRAERNGEGGFAATHGGSLTGGEECLAKANSDVGYISAGAGSFLEVGPRSSAQGQTAGRAGDGNGFAVMDGGALVARPGCSARRNALYGFLSQHRGSTLRAEEGCISEANDDAGYLSIEGGRLDAGPGCQAVRGKAEGFCSTGGHMTLGAGCRAAENAGDGVLVCRRGIDLGGGRSGLGPECGTMDASVGSCVAERNGGAGFCVEDDGCELTVGAGSAARANKGGAGYLAKAGGMMAVAEGSVAERNAGWGLLVTGAGARMRLAAGCREAAAQGGNALGAVSCAAGAGLMEV
ncbi:hypothetical protein GPECTOR_97g766 [Gonium pectorale]|uniref:Right handed beta helix domain-containing protein n=1 Tax=Gonium pectorale TaxID=33097 RepID=A0A150G070_GONPE|nr:hypothetical protein GPECTOR_97g766 [Gonium pectorale]|eukprot:KXZ43228.1 hypothetical protein GPECTOR_97g766 [Gonium pectorale]